jgi:multidrug efflux pump subunit AcrB
MPEQITKSGILAWFVKNHVAANLLMMLVIVSGLLAIFSAKLEVFPETELDMISIQIPYRGSSPEDVETGVLLRVEEAIAAIDGVKRINSTASEGMGSVIVEIEEYADATEVLEDVKAGIDRITTFPSETEKPIISEIKTSRKVITIALYGDCSEKTLKKLSDQIRDDLTAKDNISQVDISGLRPYEISIEVSEENLRRYGLSFEKLANIVSQSSLDIPAGSVKTSGGEILLRTKGQKYYGDEFEKIIVLTKNDGTQVSLADIATVKDDFEDVDLYTKFDGKTAALIHVSRIGRQGAIDVADTVKKYIQEKTTHLPEGISIALWEDDSLVLRSRINLLKKNAYIGLVLVFLCLTLFLDLRLAIWITMGIPISFLGAFWIMPLFNVSINMISLFALIMALGLVVDDAIVVGENIFTYRQQSMEATAAAIKGVKEMAIPVILSVLTTIFAFIPLAYTTGIMGKILRVMPVVMVSVLSISLIEALLILPAHLASKPVVKRNIILVFIDRIRIWFDKKLDQFVNGRFSGLVSRAVKWRYVTISIGIAVLLITAGFVKGGFIKFVFIDPVEADNMVATLTMPQGTPIQQTRRIIDRIEQAGLKVISDYDRSNKTSRSVMKHIATTLGAQPSSHDRGPDAAIAAGQAMANLAEVNIELLGGEQRDASSVKLTNQWRKQVGEIPGVSSLIFRSEIFRTGDDINFELSHKSFDKLLVASEELKSTLPQYAGVSDISDSFQEGKAEIKLSLKQASRPLGITLSDLARQVREGFYGAEAQRIQRGRDDIRVMVRYPKNRRKSLADIENMRIRLSDGTEIPFKTVAQVEYGRGYAAIKRLDRRRVVNVIANVDESVANATEINKDLYAKALPELARRYPGLQYRFAGTERERNESLVSLKRNFIIALFAIYALLAIQFRSYTQPVIVMSAIPFGIVGATLTHLLFGYNLSILSMFGIVALSGVVVNDSLIMIDLINRERKSGIALAQVIHDSATRRFRPIMLTTLTTFFGLFPMILERSLQARFLIPMAISLAFGVMFATMVTLILVPSLYMILEDLKNRF